MSNRYPELFILRHGETEWNRARRVQGRLDSPLTPLGRAQARAQGIILMQAGVSVATHDFITSPQGRAVATAELALNPIGASARHDARLCEIDMGRWQGLTMDEIGGGWPGVMEGETGLEWYDHSPGGERLADLQVRSAGVLSALSGPTVIVAHGILSRVLRTVALGLPLSAFAEMPGGQGVVYHLRDGVQTRLDPPFAPTESEGLQDTGKPG